MEELPRILRPNPFANDTGQIEAELAEAIAQPVSARTEAIVAALAAGRVVLPISPHAKPDDVDALRAGKLPAAQNAAAEPGCTSDIDLDLSIPAVDYPGGASALPIFSSASQLAQWNSDYRPLLLKTRAAAALALQRYGGQMALDPGTTHQTWLGRSVTVAWLTEVPWIAPWADPALAEYLAEAADINAAFALRVHGGPRGASVIQVGIPRELAERQVLQDAVQKITTALAEDTYLKARFDVIEIRPEILDSSVS